MSTPPLAPPAAATAAAIEHFAAKLRFETDPSDVAAALAAGERFAFLDVRGHDAWHQGRPAGAVHLPRVEIEARAPLELDRSTPVVVACWGPACNGATKAALALSRLGFEVREMIGGFEYWAREGLPVVDDQGPVERMPDPLTAVVAPGAVDCDC